MASSNAGILWKNTASRQAKITLTAMASFTGLRIKQRTKTTTVGSSTTGLKLNPASSCAIAGIVEGTDLTARLGGRTGGGHLKTYQKTLVTGFVTAAIGCNQTIAIVLTHAVRKDAYQTLGNQAFARDMSFAGTLAPVLVPWCIAAYTPTSQLDVHGLGWMPFAFWLWFMLLWQGVYAWRMDRKAG